MQKDALGFWTWLLSLGYAESRLPVGLPLIEVSRGRDCASFTVLPPGPSRVVPWKCIIYWKFVSAAFDVWRWGRDTSLWTFWSCHLLSLLQVGCDN